MQLHKWILLCLFSCLGCATPEPGRLYHLDMTPVSDAELETMRKQRMESLRAKAAFDLACSGEAIKVSCLSSDTNALCISAGVVGCEKRVSYVWTKTSIDASQWVGDVSATSN